MAGQGRLQSLMQGAVVLSVLSHLSSTVIGTTQCPHECYCDVAAGEMDCSNRGLTQIPSHIDSWVKVLRLDRNPLVCDCNTIRLHKALPDNTLQGARCSNLNNRHVSDVASDYPDLCAVQSLAVQQDYKIHITLLLPWDSDYQDALSEKYKELSTRMISELDELFKERPPSNYALDFTDFREQSGNTQAGLDMSSELPVHTSIPWYRDQIYLLIRNAAFTGRFSFGMDVRELYVNSGVIGKKFCPIQIPKETDAGLIWWDSQLPGDTTIAPCPENPDRNATRLCIIDQSGFVYWKDKIISACQTPSDRTKGLEDLSHKPVTNETIAAIVEELANLTQDMSNFTCKEVSLVANITQSSLTAPNVPVMDKETGATLLVSVNRMLSVDTDTLMEAERHSKSATRLVESVERLGNKMEGTKEGVKIAEPDIGVLVTKPPEAGLLFETVGDMEQDLSTERMRVNIFGPILPDLSRITAAVHVPLSVVQQGQNENIHFAVYNSDSFFEASERTNRGKGEANPEETRYLLNSQVVSAKVGMLDLIGLNDSVTIALRHINNTSAKHLCFYWDFIQSKWSPDGCSVTFSNNSTTTCQCNHLTNFALLMDIYGTGDQIKDIHEEILSILSYIGCTVSATGLILTLITYLTFRRLLQDTPSKILVNLCAALLGIIVSFVFTSQWFVTNNIMACKVFAALTHYFILSSMAWMSIEAFNMYMALVRVFHPGFSKFLLKCCLIGWGTPLVVVGTTVGVSSDNYGLQGEICWLAHIPFLAAVMAPLVLSLILNGPVFGLVLYQSSLQWNKLRLEKSKSANIKSRLLGAAGIMVLLGLTWIFAFFAVGEVRVVFQYLFVVSNTLQGTFIFVFHCVRNKDARLACMGCVRSARPETHVKSSSGGVSNRRHKVSPFSAEMRVISGSRRTSRTSE